ncbi:MAG: BON domain-containing protein [Rhodothermales bacterium]|nr:BON domain-containing protein [Rhodothermales bacterium]MCA0270070.1 BON domain-containing protein [Bacteroidota bacterium]
MSLVARFNRMVTSWLRAMPLGNGTHPRTLRDAAVARRVANEVERGAHRGRYVGVQFYVFEGEVALIGTVARQRDADALAARLERVPGVVGVISHLQVVEGILGTHRPPPDDAP